MTNALLLISIVAIAISYLRIILIYLNTKDKRVDNITGFDLAKELTSNYNEINIVESKEVNISKYNIKRRIIRFTRNNYEGNDIYTLSISALLAGYSLLNINKDKNLQLLGKILPSIDYLNKSSIIALLISLFTNKAGDAKIALIILIIILIYQYLINEINISSKEQTAKSLKKILKKDNYSLIEQVQNTFLTLNKISFITTLILIIREVLIII